MNEPLPPNLTMQDRLIARAANQDNAIGLMTLAHQNGWTDEQTAAVYNSEMGAGGNWDAGSVVRHRAWLESSGLWSPMSVPAATPGPTPAPTTASGAPAGQWSVGAPPISMPYAAPPAAGAPAAPSDLPAGLRVTLNGRTYRLVPE